MNDWARQFKDLEAANEDAMASFERERRRLADVTKKLSEEITEVRSKDRSLTVEFDGRGEITAINFQGTKYRTMPPAELSHVLLETIRVGRAQCVEKLTEVMGKDLLPGVDFAEFAQGRIKPDEILDKVVGPFLGDAYDDGIIGRKASG